MKLFIFSLLLLTLCGCGPCAVLLLICSVGLHFGSLKFLNVLNNIFASTLYHLDILKQLLGFIFLLLELLLLNLVAQVGPVVHGHLLFDGQVGRAGACEVELVGLLAASGATVDHDPAALRLVATD